MEISKINIQTLPKHILCFSHLRWDFVFQRPQHLLSRFSEEQKVYFLEEPVFSNTTENYLADEKKSDNLVVLVPHLQEGMKPQEVTSTLTKLIDKFLKDADLNDWLFWYYTPMAYSFSHKYRPGFIVYDCMDELSAFKFAPKEIIEFEKKLMSKADVVFTGGHSLFKAKKSKHENIYPFPSSIEKEHFGKARMTKNIPVDLRDIDGVKIGYFGVIDERFDLNLIEQIAERRPSWQIILIGPVVKISTEVLPKNKNIHYLGQKKYSELPLYLAEWDVALIPFLLNESTRYISPTKTPEYLAAGKPVVSTPIHDVIDPYGVKNLVHICGNYKGFIKAIESELATVDRAYWLKKVDKHLENLSWEKTVMGMKSHILETLNNKKNVALAI